MKNRRYVLLTVGIILTAFTLSSPAQQEHWLRYHSASEVSLLGTSTNMQVLELSNNKPSEVKPPQFESDEPYFAKWTTPMVKAGYLWIACDRSHKYGPYDLLYIDSNGNGHLDDETVVKANRTDQYSAYFGPVKVIFEIEDGPVTYHLNLRFYGYENRTTRLYVSTGGWYEGDITVDGEKKYCVLFDYNANGTFNDKSLNATECDRIRIGKKGAEDIRFVGHFIDIDGILYRPEIARDGAYIKLAKAENVQSGNVRVPEEITQISAGGENGLFTLEPEKGIASLPVGQYRINDWTIERKDEQGTPWKLKGAGMPGKGLLIDVAADKPAELSIGEPIISTLNASASEGTYSFRYDMEGREGERIELTRNGTRPQAPKLNVKSKDGTYDRTYSFQYGWGGTCSLSWREPKNVKGPLTATVDVGGPFKIETKPYTIAAKVELAEAEEATSTPEAKPAVAAEEAPETPKAEPASETAQAEETPATEGKKTANWIVLSVLIGLGVAAAGFAVYKKTV